MIIAVDYGLRRCGLAVSYEGEIAEPLMSIKPDHVIKKLQELKPETVVVGISGGKSAEVAKKFAKQVKDMVKCNVELVDETLTTVEAREITRDKDDNAVAAALILQRYLDV